MYWLIAAPSVLLVIALLGLLPYGGIRQAVRNARVSSSRIDAQRARRELRHLGKFLGWTLLLPLALLALVQIGLLLHHHLLGPGHLLANVFGEYHPEVALNAPDLEAWAAAYEEARRDGRIASGGGVSAATAFWEHWPLYPAYLLLSATFVLVFLATGYVRRVRAYVAGVRRRGRQNDAGWGMAYHAHAGSSRRSSAARP